MKIPPPVTLDSASSDLSQRVAGLPTAQGVFCLEVDGRITHLSSAPNLQRRIERTLAKIARLGSVTEEHTLLVHCWRTSSKLRTSLLLYALAKVHFPDDYLRRVHLRMPWFVGLLTRDRFPRLIAANRIPVGCEPVIGPFARRDLAQIYQQEVEGAFLLRRCTEVLQPSPQHPGCIYGEMKQCLRPCQCAVDDARYLAEAVAVSGFLGENGLKSISQMTRVRDQATADLDFESAARIHKQIERFKDAHAARDAVITNVDVLNGVALVRVRDGEAVELFPLLRGRWVEPLLWEQGADPVQTRDLEAYLRGALSATALEDQASQRDTLEDLALFSRWYYSSWREGVWLPIPRLDEPPIRKIARSLQHLLKKPMEHKQEVS